MFQGRTPYRHWTSRNRFGLAFIQNSEIGAHYKSAEVNGEYVDIDYVLQPNDTILIHKNDTLTARIEWFRILETKTAVNRLITTLKSLHT